MKVNFKKKFKNVDGSEMQSPDIADTIASFLFNYGKEGESKEVKYKAYQLCNRISQADGEISISVEEASFIKDVCNENLTAGGFGQVVDILENNLVKNF